MFYSSWRCDARRNACLVALTRDQAVLESHGIQKSKLRKAAIHIFATLNTLRIRLTQYFLFIFFAEKNDEKVTGCCWARIESVPKLSQNASVVIFTRSRFPLPPRSPPPVPVRLSRPPTAAHCRRNEQKHKRIRNIMADLCSWIFGITRLWLFYEMKGSYEHVLYFAFY